MRPTDTASHTARSDPSRVYASPLELARDASLTVDERLEMLRRWDFDVRERHVAAGEGMTADTPPTDLAEIASAIATLEGNEPATTETPTQHGSVPAKADDTRTAARLADIPLGPGQGPGHPPASRPSLGAALAFVGAFVALLALAAALEAPLVAAIGFVALAVGFVFARRRPGAR